ncbi:MAG: hypothetical protein AMXMBFR84_41180 [Candidatus Hydrogenedentota bacterium]
MAYRFGKSRKTIAEINITPLTDVFLVLLVMVMVAAPALSNYKRDIATPQVTKADALSNEWLMVDVDKSGVMYIEGQPVPDDALAAKLAEKVNTVKEKKIVIRGDKSTKSSGVLRIMREAEIAGFEMMFVAGEGKEAAPGATTVTLPEIPQPAAVQ